MLLQTVKKCGSKPKVSLHELRGFLRSVHTSRMNNEITIRAESIQILFCVFPIHDRMPVILPGVDIEKWINPDSKPDEIIKNAITDMVFEKIIA